MSERGWGAQQLEAAGAALHQWLPVLRSQRSTTTTEPLVSWSRIVPCMYCSTTCMDMWHLSTKGSDMTAVLIQTAKLVSGIHFEAPHTASLKARSSNQAATLADLDLLPVDDYCRVAHARHCAGGAAAADPALPTARIDSRATAFDTELPAAYAPDVMGAAVPCGLHACNTWHRFRGHVMRPRRRGASTEWWALPEAEPSGEDSDCWRSHAGACGSRRTVYMVGFARRR